MVEVRDDQLQKNRTSIAYIAGLDGKDLDWFAVHDGGNLLHRALIQYHAHR